MDWQNLVSKLAALIGDLRPHHGGQEALSRATADVASSLASGQAELPGRQQTLERALAAPASLTDAADQALKPVQSQASGALTFRRELPLSSTLVPGSQPQWAAGRAVTASHGPFLDRLGREVFIDLFEPLQMVAFVRGGDAQPFLLVEVRGLPLNTDSINLEASSIWFRSSLLAPAAPASGYTGLKIASGTLSFGTSLTLSGTTVIVPAGLTLTLALQLTASAATAGPGPGKDARDMVVQTPGQATFAFGPAGASVSGLGNANLTVYGQTVPLTPSAGAPAYEADVAQIAVPYQTTTAALAISSPHSTLISPAGTASIASTAWALPVAVVSDPATLGAASGAGGLRVRMHTGLRASWQGRTTPVDLGECALFAEHSILSLVAAAAQFYGGVQRIPLWDDGSTRGNVDLRDRVVSPWRYVAAGSGTEIIVYQTQATVLLDRPVTSSSGRVPVSCSDAILFILQAASGTRLVLESAVDPPPGAPVRYAFALANAVLETGPAGFFSLFGPYDSGAVRTGFAVLDFRLTYLLPILPDPYATNIDYSTLRGSQSGDLGMLAIELGWAPHAPLQLTFLLPPGADGLTQPLLQPSASSHGKTAEFVLNTVDRFPAASGALEEDQINQEALARRFPHGGGPELALLDVSTNVSQFGVAFSAPSASSGSLVAAVAPAASNASSSRFVVEDMFLQTAGSNVRVITLPEVQWEPVATRDGPPFPTPMTFADCGGPTEFATETVELVRVAPRPALDFLVAGYQRAVNPLPVDVRFTLPFGIEAVANLRRTSAAAPSFSYVTPQFPARGLAGCDQVSLKAGPDTPVAGAVALSGLPGAAIQLRNGLYLGVPTGGSVLTPIDVTFNGNFGPGSPLARVPVKRIDLSGYGESLFSEWTNPVDAAAIISKAEFDVLTGRTSLEIVQAYSILYPYAVRVVRTITIQRENGGTVVRHDSGWQAVTNGVYSYPAPGLRTHPGVVRGVRDVINIRDTGQTFTTSDGSQLMAVRFDCDVEIEGVIRGGTATGVPSRDQLGFVQLTDPPHRGLLAETQYRELIEAFPTLGGAVDCVINVGGSGHQMRITRVGIGAATIGVPEFVMAAYGSPVFPAGGQWSFIRQNTSDDSTQSVDQNYGVPLVRQGLAPPPPPASSPYRFADPQDLLQPTTPAMDYGILHATGTQRLLLPRPKIEAGAHSITSTRQILLADPYALATASGHFPHTAVTVTIPDPAWRLDIVASDHFRLSLSQAQYQLSPERILVDAPPIHTVVRYHDEHGAPSTVRIAIDTAAPIPWSFSATNVLLTSHSDSYGEMMTVIADINASAGTQTGFNNVRTLFGGALQPVMDALSLVGNFGSSSPPYDVGMTNDWKLIAGLKISAVKAFTAAMQVTIPVLEDLNIKALQRVLASPLASETTFEIDATLAIPVTGPFVVVILARFQVKVFAGGSPDAFNGVAVVFQLGIGCGLQGKIGPFKAIGYVMVTAIFVFGDVSGIGWSALAKFHIDLKIIEIEVSVEGGTAHLNSSCGAGPSIQHTGFNVQQATVAVDITIAWVIDIEFEYQSTSVSVTNVSNSALPPCDFPDVL